MLSRRAAMIGMGVGMVALAATPAHAHRERMTTSWVEWNGAGFDVTHTFHRHDAESALAVSGLLDRPDLSTLKARALLAIHTEETFSLGEDIALVTLGAEVFGDRVEVYQVADLPEMPDTLDVRASMLRGLWRDQVNAVDVDAGGSVRSLRFAGSDEAKPLSLT